VVFFKEAIEGRKEYAVAHNEFNGRHARCRTCGFFWAATYKTAEEDDCIRCKEVREKDPIIVEWVLSVIENAIEKHTGNYKHDHHDWD